MFGSTCQHIVLSGGTFSWLIGFLGFFSDVYFPSNREKVWYGDIFVFPRWKGVESKDSIKIVYNDSNNNEIHTKKTFLTPRNILPKVDINNIDLNDFLEEESMDTDSSGEHDKNITEK